MRERLHTAGLACTLEDLLKDVSSDQLHVRLHPSLESQGLAAGSGLPPCSLGWLMRQAAAQVYWRLRSQRHEDSQQCQDAHVTLRPAGRHLCAAASGARQPGRR